jgi:integrase
MKYDLRSLYEYYVDIYRAERSDQVKRNYKYNFEKYVLRFIGEEDIRTLLPSVVNVIVGDMTGKGQTTINSVYNDLVFIFRNAYMDGILDRDVSKAIRKPKAKKDRPRRALTSKEREAVLNVARSKSKYYAYLLMILCGCRPSEAFNVETDDFDFEKETVHIRGTKTATSDRVIPCPRIILSIAEKSPYGPLTVSETGLKVSKECQVRIWKSFWIDCHKYLGGSMYRNAPREPYPFGKDLTAYNLRHEYCTELARKGIDIRITQRLMGHASPEMTLRVYTNLNQEDLDTEDVRKVINNLHHLQD